MAVFIDVLLVAWHSRWMASRFSIRRFMVAFVLSQVLALQALLVAWGGALAVGASTPTGIGFLCSSASADAEAGNGTQSPQPNKHSDCVAACLTGHTPTRLPGAFSLLERRSIYMRALMPGEAPLSERYERWAFLARAPPMLT